MEKKYKVYIMEWLWQSPDLNLIEHFGHDLKIAVQQYSAHNLGELEKICIEEWNKMPKSKCKELRDSLEKSKL